ncbi:succinate dehydrogenase/fumarate reductase iron-sulfur subunit [Schaalia suimastitidis]|uniref:succinate dehydrogenase/fumarate reductase iron-sulfur subunit n=1 Tax=Schaalia suimastitidis TaxID=121163 RepID=UPI000415B685|nr:succinate dehydrogenase/fumarate reductase iron-sulfur subunit [Schaalia suimastitidis]
MNIILKIWRQNGPNERGTFVEYPIECEPHMSILEALDSLNEILTKSGGAPVAFESDCREGICGACGLTVDGKPHGWHDNLPACHQRLGQVPQGHVITIEPLRSGLYPVIKDLVVDRSVLDHVTMANGYASVDTGLAPDADSTPIGHDTAEAALDFAACIGCGACVAACPNGSAALYAGARLAHLARLPIPAMERRRRARATASALDEYFGACSGYGECVRVCPAGIDLGATSMVGRERWWAFFHPSHG